MYDESAYEHFIPVISSKGIEIDYSRNRNKFVSRDGSQWKEYGSRSAICRLAIQNIFARK